MHRFTAPVRTSALRHNRLALAILLAASAPAALAQQVGDDAEDEARRMDTVTVTAEQIARQALGSSIITVDDIERRPPANDLSELIRTMPGVNLTGNSASGQYGNNRQIDIRGMGPENTLILVDGRPISSRNSVRMGRSGERNTRGDTNWVPADAVERIEVLRGPAAARYGSGASGGVVNIVTKKPTGDFGGSVTAYANAPEHSEEGASRRVGFNLSGPLADALSFRLYGNVARTEADDISLNADTPGGQGDDVIVPPAGREGVRNRDIDGLLRWDANDDHLVELQAGVSRQGNIYAGDRAVSSNGTELLEQLAESGAETNIMYRRSASLTHRGSYAWGSSRLSLANEDTDNKRLNEGLAGGPEGSINTDAVFSTSNLRSWRLDGEANINLDAGVEQVVTVGFEYRDERLDDPFSVTQSAVGGAGVPGLDDRSGRNDMTTEAVFVEDNIYATERLILTPGLRFDHSDKFGGNWSPSLNVSYDLTDTWMLKGGIARAYKAPNLYQSNPGYLYYTRGNGCPYNFPNLGGGCYIQGSADLDPETSINKEIGVAYDDDRGLTASLTYFDNDYRDKIVTGLEPQGVNGATQIFAWENAPEASVRGVEGSLNLPLDGNGGRTLKWTNNLTWMLDNENEETGQPLSIIPEYTLNTGLDWQATDDLDLLLTGTFYGDQEPPTLSIGGAPLEGDALEERDAYNVWNLGVGYTVSAAWRLGAGVNNIFDERLFREANNTSQGAATYNEPGRLYYVSLTARF
uniref:TonB-dependent siderophore receptor n=1 Tax=Coralloluteibacterium stylophorae TaxID=1776034 RepID=A0A8J7VS06_9GAMM